METMKIVSKHPVLLWSASLMLASVALYGCKDFLSDAAAPQGTLNEQTLATATGVEGNLIAAYRALDWNNGVGGAWGNAASNWVWGSVASDDAYKGSEASDQPPIDQVEAYHWSTADVEGYLNEKWRGAYEGVVRANSTLRLLAEVQAASPTAIDATNAAGIEGEAKFLRAHYHFEAWRMWGNIPYYREDDTDFRKANETSALVITDILADLDAAIAKLPVAPRFGQVGRASQWTAKAYKGRVQVYAKQYAAAITTLREVQATGPFALESSFDRVWSGYADAQNGKETILAYQASSNDGEPDGNNANFGERLNFPHSGSHFGCCGFHQPSQNLVNFFQVDAAGLPLATSATTTWNANNANFVAGSAAAVDPRLDWTVGRDGVPYKDWGAHNSSWIRAPAYGGTYSPKKNIHEKGSGSEQSAGGWAPTQQNSVNIHIFRYADMLLLLAEAEVEQNNLAQALAIVNQIRTRAGAKAQGPGTDRATTAVALTDPSITWATYRVGLYPAFASQAVAREAVRNERRLELAMEGQRFFDLRRWGIADVVLNGYLDGVGGGNEKTRRQQKATSDRWAGATDRHYLFPIPSIQIELSKVGGQNRLTQNPGW
jgi:starch-binding outer membrane protein, SusD/RagB family